MCFWLAPPGGYTHVIPCDLLAPGPVKLLRRLRRLTDATCSSLPDACYVPLPSVGRLVLDGGIDVRVSRCSFGGRLYMCLWFRSAESASRFASVVPLPR